MSEGCRNCYAESVAHRFSGAGLPYEGLVQLDAEGNSTGKWNGKIRFVEDHLLDPLKWKEPRRIFVNSMSDLFHENVTDEMRDKIFAVTALCPQHTFQVLTKRPDRMLAYLGVLDTRIRIEIEVARQIELRWHERSVMPEGYAWQPCGIVEGESPWPPPNVHLGVSVENQDAADIRVPLLLSTPAAVRFVSCEPLLGEVGLVAMQNTVARFDPLPAGYEKAVAFYLDALRGCRCCVLENCDAREEEEGSIAKIDWVIVGGESGPGARPMHPDWARGLRDQCKAAGVPFFFKQWGEWLGSMQDGATTERDGLILNCSDSPLRVGTKLSGHLLDGVEYHEFPAVIP